MTPAKRLSGVIRTLRVNYHQDMLSNYSLNHRALWMSLILLAFVVICLTTCKLGDAAANQSKYNHGHP